MFPPLYSFMDRSVIKCRRKNPSAKNNEGWIVLKVICCFLVVGLIFAFYGRHMNAVHTELCKKAVAEGDIVTAQAELGKIGSKYRDYPEVCDMVRDLADYREAEALFRQNEYEKAFLKFKKGYLKADDYRADCIQRLYDSGDYQKVKELLSGMDTDTQEYYWGRMLLREKGPN